VVVQPTAALEIAAGYPAMSFALAMVKPRISVDGGPPVVWLWGSGTLPVSSGRHRVQCSFRWAFFSHAGNAELDVDVPDGGMVRLRYAPPPKMFVFNKGRLTEEGTVGMQGGGAGWNPDPSRRHELRYWDGSSWTSHVSTNGVAGTDPMG